MIKYKCKSDNTRIICDIPFRPIAGPPENFLHGYGRRSRHWYGIKNCLGNTWCSTNYRFSFIWCSVEYRNKTRNASTLKIRNKLYYKNKKYHIRNNHNVINLLLIWILDHSNCRRWRWCIFWRSTSNWIQRIRSSATWSCTCAGDLQIYL